MSRSPYCRRACSTMPGEGSPGHPAAGQLPQAGGEVAGAAAQVEDAFHAVQGGEPDQHFRRGFLHGGVAFVVGGNCGKIHSPIIKAESRSDRFQESISKYLEATRTTAGGINALTKSSSCLSFA